MNRPRVLIAGTSSGSGKTTAVCAVLELLKRRDLRVKACKCGPDYIDPMFHTAVLNVPSANLDPFFCEPSLLRKLLIGNSGDDVTVIEGVMGYYDGTGPDGTENSSFTVADETDTPAVLIVDAKGAAASLLALIEGFVNFKKDSRIRGVIFNRMSAGTYTLVKGLMKDRFGDSPVPAGYIPRLPDECVIPSRHLGLVTAAEIEDLKVKIGAAADACEKTLDIDALISIAGTAGELPYDVDGESDIKSAIAVGGESKNDNAIYSETQLASRERPKTCGRVKIAVAKDAAFCFYYKDTLSLLEKLGAEIVTFSPLKNEPVPEGAAGLLLGGGYPELYVDQLEKNTVSRKSVSQAVRSGMPAIAECGGFQYLGRMLDGRQMCGVLPHSSFPAGRLVRFGYVTLTAKEDGLFGSAGTTLRGHEFHYWDSSDNGNSFTAVKPGGRQWDCAVYGPSLYAGYPHLFLPSNPEAAASFYRKCLEYGAAL